MSRKPASCAEGGDPHDAGGRARQHRARRETAAPAPTRSLRHSIASDAAVAAYADLREPRLQLAEILSHDRTEIGVDHRGREPLVFPELRRDLVRYAEERVGYLFLNDRADARLVRGAMKLNRQQTAIARTPSSRSRLAAARTSPRRAPPGRCRRTGRARRPRDGGRAAPRMRRLLRLQIIERVPLLTPSSMMSRKPRVVIIPVSAPRPTISALVATVVP